jgi:hypothetical protein
LPLSVLLSPPCTSRVALTGVFWPTFVVFMVTTQFWPALSLQSWYVTPPAKGWARWMLKPEPHTCIGL